MLEPLGNHAQRQSLHLGNGFIAIGAVAHDANQVRDLGKPTAVFFLFEFDAEGHERNLPPTHAADNRCRVDS